MRKRLNAVYIFSFIFFCTACWYVGKERVGGLLRSIQLIPKDHVPDNFYIYRAYLDRRGTSPKLRLLSFNKCHDDSVLYARVSSTWWPLKPTPMYEVCPEVYAPGCSLVAYYHEMKLDDNFNEEEVMIKSQSHTELLPLYVAEPAKKWGITACIAPMFWYSDWTRLIFFIEYWRKQQVVQMMFYVHTTTSKVKEVLNFYEKKGWVKVIPWPMLPSTDFFQPNQEVYRLGQTLAHNDCFLRSETEYTVVVDVDEIFSPQKEQPFIDFINEKFANKSIGSLRFNHYAAVMHPPLLPRPFHFEEVSYAGVHYVYFRRERKRQPKMIARTNAVDIMAIHTVVAYRNKEITVRLEDAYLLHIRYSWQSSEIAMQNKTIVPDANVFQQELLNATKTIFPNGADFKEEIEVLLGECTDNFREAQHACKAPTTYCRSFVKDKEIWVEETEDTYTVL